MAEVPGVAGSEPPAEELAPLKVDLTEIDILKSQWPSSFIFSAILTFKNFQGGREKKDPEDGVEMFDRADTVDLGVVAAAVFCMVGEEETPPATEAPALFVWRTRRLVA